MSKRIRSWLLSVSLLAALAGVVAVAPSSAQAHAQAAVSKQGPQLAVLANALIQFETATRWESMAPSWRGRRDGWIARVRSAGSPAQLAALTIELETIMTWEAMYPQWRQQRAPWLQRTGSSATNHDVAQALIALEAATTWNAMFENRWRAVRAGWVAQLQGI